VMFAFVLGEEGDCWWACGEKGGTCAGFCGAGKACCRFGFADDPAECNNAAGTDRWKHYCVTVDSNALTTTNGLPTPSSLPTVLPLSSSASSSLGGDNVTKGDPCGIPRSDRKDWSQLTQQEQDAAIALGWTQQSWTDTTSRPESDDKTWAELTQEEKDGAVTLGWNVSSWDCEGRYRHDSDCFPLCGNKSGKCGFCGLGKACCRTAWPNQPPECAGAITAATHHQCVEAAKVVPTLLPPLIVNESTVNDNTAYATDGMKCTNETDENGNITTVCALVGGNSSDGLPWWAWLVLLLLLLCCLISLLMWLLGCFDKKSRRSKGGKKGKRGKRGDVEQQESFVGSTAGDRDLAPLMPGRETSARSTDPLMLNQEASAGEMSAFGLIDRRGDGVITRSELQFAQQQMGTQQLTQVIAGAAPPSSFVSYPTGGQQQQWASPPTATAPPIMVGGQVQPIRSVMPGVTGQAMMPQSFQPAVQTVHGGYPVQSITTVAGNVMPAGGRIIR